MANMASLPVELLIMIYRRLDTVSDILHLSRTCLATYAVLELEGVRVDLIKSVLVCIQYVSELF
jgi:hypothetical protein